MGVSVPDPPLVAAGAAGGPFVIYLTTPMRNALTLAALDSSQSVGGLYREVFSAGLARGWVGGHYFAAASCPGFLCLGPLFHIYKDLAGSAAIATVMSGVSESIVLYGSETKNAQVAYNQSAAKRGIAQLARTQSAFIPWGPAISLHIARNTIAMSGLRVLSGPCQELVGAAAPGMSPEARAVVGDFVGNCGAAALSAPVHLLYSFMATQRLAQGGESGVGKTLQACTGFLRHQYLTAEGRLSCVAARDVFLRMGYIATIYTIFGAIERAAVTHWPASWRRHNA